MSEVKILDMSAWQNYNVPYADFKNKYGIYSVILRITERNNKIDTMFDKHYKECIKNNLSICAVYKYSYALTLEALIEQANQVVETLKKYPNFKGPVFLDLEWKQQLKLGKTTLTKFAQTFEKIIKTAGYGFGIYCSSSFLDFVIDRSLVSYDLWLASYPYNDNGTIVERLRPNFKGQIGWQYSSAFKMNGQDYDISVFNKDYIDKILSGNPIIEPEKPASEIQDQTAAIVESAISFMENVARDDKHGYSQDSRWGTPDYDCSSLVITAWQNAGIPVKSMGASYTGNMYNIFIKCGFKDVTNQVNLSNGSNMKRGDVLLNHVHHTAMYCGNGQEVEASINERGGAHGGQPGDQTGREILIRSYRNYPWNAILRYGNGSTTSTQLTKGSSGEKVKKLQTMLITCGYSCGSYGADGDFGNATQNALKAFQKDYNLTPDGVYGPYTKEKLTLEYKKYPYQAKVLKKAYIRKQPGGEYENLETLKKDSIITVYSKTQNKIGKAWYKAKGKNKTGYINGEKIQHI